MKERICAACIFGILPSLIAWALIFALIKTYALNK